MSTYGDLITDALAEIRAARAGDVVNADDMAYGLRQLNRLLDQWNADRPKVFRSFYQDFTLTANHSPHTIGVSGADFIVTGNRPVSIDAAAWNLGGSPAAFQPIAVRDAQWYATVFVPGLVSGIATDVYYDPAYDSPTPVGNLYFYPVPSGANGVRLWIRQVLASVAQTDTVTLPQGYDAALMLTLAEILAPGFGQSVAPGTAKRASEARAVIEANNRFTPSLQTRDSGMQPTPSASGLTRSQFLSRGAF